MTNPAQYALAIITDTHVAKQVAIQLRNNGIDIVRLEEVNDLPNNASDSQILIWATDNERAVLSLDNDFRDLHFEWMAQGRSHKGIFYGKSKMQGKIGVVVNFIVDFASIVDDMSDMENQLIDIKDLR